MAKGISMSKSESEWRAEDDFRTLAEAIKIKKDPARLKAAQAIAVKKMQAAEEIKDLKKTGK